MMAQLPPGVGEELPPGVGPALPEAGPLAPPSLTGLPKGPGGYPIVPPEMRSQVRDVPSTAAIAWKNLRTQWPELAAMAVGTPFAGPLKAALAGSAALTGGKLAQGAPLEEAATAGGVFGGASAGTHGLLKGILASAGSGPLRSAFASDTMQKLGDLLKAKVPAYKDFPSDARGVHGMLMRPEGYQALHKWYDTYVKDITRRGQGVDIEISLADAKTLGIPVRDTLTSVTNRLKNPARDMEYRSANAAQAAEKALGQWAKHPGEYRRIMDALDDAALGDPAMRMGYKTAMGVREFLGRQNALKGERYHPEIASKGLNVPKLADMLNRRGLGEVYNIIRGPGPRPITPTNISPWTRRIIGGSVGEGLGWLGGGPPGMGFVPGAAAGELLIPSTKGAPVPQGLQDLLRTLSMQGGVQSARVPSPLSREP